MLPLQAPTALPPHLRLRQNQLSFSWLLLPTRTTRLLLDLCRATSAAPASPLLTPLCRCALPLLSALWSTTLRRRPQVSRVRARWL